MKRENQNSGKTEVGANIRLIMDEMAGDLGPEVLEQYKRIQNDFRRQGMNTLAMRKLSETMKSSMVKKEQSPMESMVAPFDYQIYKKINGYRNVHYDSSSILHILKTIEESGMTVVEAAGFFKVSKNSISAWKNKYKTK